MPISVQTNPKVFLRNATGLVKQVSLLDQISLNVSNMSVGAGLALVSSFTALFPSMSGINLVYGTILAFIIFLPQIVIYTIMSGKIARTGGDYVWISRTFGGAIGGPLAFVAFIAVTLSYLALIALSTAFAIGSVGVILGNTSFLGLALPGNAGVPGSDPFQQVIVAGLIFAVLIAINIFSPRAGFKVVSAFVIAGIVITLVAITTLFSAGNAGVQGYVHYLNATQGLKYTYSSIAASYTGPVFNLGSTIAILPFFAIFAFPFINASPAVGSEVKNRKSLTWSIPISAIIVLVLMTACFATMYYVGGFNFIQGALGNPTLVFGYSFNFWTLAMGVTTNMPLQFVIGLGWILWEVAILGFGIIFFSRYLFAQSFDRYLPASFAYVSPRYSSPIRAHLLDLVMTVGLIASAAYLYGTFISLFGALIASLIYFVFIGLTAVIYGIRKEKGSTRWVLAVAGILSAAVFIFVIYQFIEAPTIWGGNWLAYGYIIAAYIVGFGIYAVSHTRLKSKGIDLGLAFKEIPPE